MALRHLEKTRFGCICMPSEAARQLPPGADAPDISEAKFLHGQRDYYAENSLTVLSSSCKKTTKKVLKRWLD